MKKFSKILIANRGEIAVRVIRGCREMGIASVAVFSEADRGSLHARAADEAVFIGPAPALESYLNMDRIIQAAHKTGAEAIHPGYGFLAENAAFARLCEQENLVFIGPGSAAMELVGDKVRARQTMEAAGVPIIPGMKGIAAGLEEYQAQAERIGYPVMIKASAGGGGKGMRIVSDPEGLKAAIEAGQREALAAFGDESVYLEKYIREPRHVEFQVLADLKGRAVHLFERECSIQRRHQKIIEESPSPALDESLRAKMGETALKVMQTAGYSNAGTVEFLLDQEKNFYFLEVNARLQVEHPVTELITGVDLVQQQIRLAAGADLDLKQSDLRQNGHAVECRIYAEDPYQNFLPSSGSILFLREPAGPGIRLDSGIVKGSEVAIYYDPILAKLIVWSETREQACRRMLRALDEYVILGVQTSIDFLKAIIGHSEFFAGRTHTGFIPQYFENWQGEPLSEEQGDAARIAAAYILMQHSRKIPVLERSVEEYSSPWDTLGRWRLGEGD